MSERKSLIEVITETNPRRVFLAHVSEFNGYSGCGVRETFNRDFRLLYAIKECERLGIPYVAASDGNYGWLKSLNSNYLTYNPKNGRRLFINTDPTDEALSKDIQEVNVGVAMSGCLEDALHGNYFPYYLKLLDWGDHWNPYIYPETFLTLANPSGNKKLVLVNHEIPEVKKSWEEIFVLDSREKCLGEDPDTFKRGQSFGYEYRKLNLRGLRIKLEKFSRFLGRMDDDMIGELKYILVHTKVSNNERYLELITTPQQLELAKHCIAETLQMIPDMETDLLEFFEGECLRKSLREVY